MKKEYIQPSIKAHKIKHAQIICGSGDSNASVPSGGGGTPPSSNNGSISGESKDYFFFED